MGAYLVLYPRVRVYTLLPLGFFFTTIALPAWAMLIYWMFLQLAGGLTGILANESGGVAFWAHVGGFLAGVVLIKLFVKRNHLIEHQQQQWQPRRVGWR
jgi:membrane associated rhomboid family serine protease